SSIIQSLFIILFFFFHYSFHLRHLLSFPTRRSSDLSVGQTFFRSKSFIYTIQCVFPERRNEYLLRKQCSFVERCIEQQRITHRHTVIRQCSVEQIHVFEMIVQQLIITASCCCYMVIVYLRQQVFTHLR